MLFYCFTHFIYPNYQQRIATVSCSSISSIVVNFQRAKVVHKASKTWNGESQPTHSRLEDATPQRYTGSVDLCIFTLSIHTKYIISLINIRLLPRIVVPKIGMASLHLTKKHRKWLPIGKHWHNLSRHIQIFTWYAITVQVHINPIQYILINSYGIYLYML